MVCVGHVHCIGNESRMAQHDLTGSLSRSLDRHLVFPLLEFLQVRGLYREEDLLQGKIELLSKTNMVDFAMDIYKNLHGSEQVPQEMFDRRTTVVARLNELQATAAPIVNFLTDESSVKQLRNDKTWNLQFLQENGIGAEGVEALYHYAKFQFDCGNYSGAAEFLYHYRTLTEDTQKSISALWGKFAAEILMQDWDPAMDDLNRLRDLIDNSKLSQLEQMQHRTWLMHWGLYVFFNHENGLNAIIDLFFQEKFLNAIQCNAPHLLRYLAIAVIINQRRRPMLKDLIRIIQQEKYTYRDPVTEFLENLFVDYDFEGAQQKLRECEDVIANDFFLVATGEEFVENARLFIFETYCRIHQCIDICLLADKLNMQQEDAERWVVNLIRNARLNAKIDSQQGTVVMGMQLPSIYEQIIERTKGLSSRTYVLANAVTGTAGGPVK